MTKSSKFHPSPYMIEHKQWLDFAKKYQIKNFPGINPIFPVPLNMQDEIKIAKAEADAEAKAKAEAKAALIARK
jgi:hypothetical protein